MYGFTKYGRKKYGRSVVSLVVSKILIKYFYTGSDAVPRVPTSTDKATVQM